MRDLPLLDLLLTTALFLLQLALSTFTAAVLVEIGWRIRRTRWKEPPGGVAEIPRDLVRLIIASWRRAGRLVQE